MSQQTVPARPARFDTNDLAYDNEFADDEEDDGTFVDDDDDVFASTVAPIPDALGNNSNNSNINNNSNGNNGGGDDRRPGAAGNTRGASGDSSARRTLFQGGVNDSFNADLAAAAAAATEEPASIDREQTVAPVSASSRMLKAVSNIFNTTWSIGIVDWLIDALLLFSFSQYTETKIMTAVLPFVTGCFYGIGECSLFFFFFF